MRAISAKSFASAPYLCSRTFSTTCTLERCHGQKKNSLLHVLPARIAKHLRRARRIRNPLSLGHHLAQRARRVLAVLEERLQTPRHHLLEADDHDAVGGAARHKGPRHGQPRAARAAVVVDVVDGDLRQPKLVEDALPARAVAVAVARDALLDVVVRDVRVQQRLDARLEPELRVVDLAAGLDELGHAHA